MRLPKDAIGYLVQQTNNSRREVLRIVSQELKGFLRNADITGALRKALAGMKLEVKAEIRFVEDGVQMQSVTRQSSGGVPPRNRGRKKG
jgi:hypothetical protein